MAEFEKIIPNSARTHGLHFVTIHTYIHPSMHACMHTSMHACMHTDRHTYIHTLYIYIYMYLMHTHIHTHIYIYIHMYVFNAHTHIHTYIYIIESYSLDVSQVAAVLLDIIQHCKVAPTYIHGIGHIRTWEQFSDVYVHFVRVIVILSFPLKYPLVISHSYAESPCLKVIKIYTAMVRNYVTVILHKKMWKSHSHIIIYLS